ncbi:3'-5' exonuclease [Clostridium arbusti]|uniref:3'-5' exonuclease n=1 Tax=Clostridium arbusti TaxID=1137848 RepID=UPI001FB0D0CA|nr:3'-5' exonuclease [Clostridium arbusti]
MSITENNHENVEVIHFHGWVNEIFKSLGLKSGVYKDKDINENIARISEDMLASDGEQNLYNRKYTLKSVGIKAAGRTTIMRENYRNTKQILDFAYTFLTDGTVQEKVDEEDNNFTIKPDTSLRQGTNPQLIYCKNFEDEANKIVDEIINLKQSGIEYGDICVAYVHKSYKGMNYIDVLNNTFSNRNIPYFIISKNSNAKSKFRIDMDKVNISTIHSVKGLDFKYVYICGINDRLLDSVNESKKLLYVGMTRAREALKVTYSNNNNAIVRDLLKVRINLNKGNKNHYKVEDMVAATKEDRIEEMNQGGFMGKIKRLFGM